MQFPNEPTFLDRAREMTASYRYRVGPMLLVGAILGAQHARAWQAVGIVVLGMLAAEGLLKVWVDQRNQSAP